MPRDVFQLRKTAVDLTPSGMDGLANDSQAESPNRDPSGHADEMVQVKVNAATSGLDDDPYVNVWLATWIEGMVQSGPDHEYFVERIPVPSGGGEVWSRTPGIAQLAGGVLPHRYKIIVENQTGAALQGSGNEVRVQPVVIRSEDAS